MADDFNAVLNFSSSAGFSKKQVAGRMKQLKRLYGEWLITDSFYRREVAKLKAAL